MYKKLDKVLALVAKTGDKMIVVSETHDPYVVMSLNDYDHLLTGSAAVNELTEEQLLDKLNRDIAIWKSAQESTDEYSLDQFKVEDLDKAVVKPEKILEETEETKENTSENKANVDDSSIEESDKYYIEPVD